MELRPLNEAEAREVCTWRYDGIYSVYNLSDWEVVVQNCWSLADDDTRKRYFLSIWQSESLIGFGRIEPEGERISLGIGLKPECCGKGMGSQAMALLVTEAQRRFPNRVLGLEVRRFNKRAIRCYEAAGFKAQSTYMKETLHGFIAYQYMQWEGEHEV